MASEAAEEVTGLATRTVSRRALAALGELTGGPMTPLARLARPDGEPAAAELREFLAGLEGPWESLPPALLDPHRTLTLLIGDGEAEQVGQYLWPDAAGAGPGFSLAVGGDELTFRGPVSTDDVWGALADSLALTTVAEIPSQRLALDARELWTLLALVDAYGTAALLRRASRATGPPPGVVRSDLALAWTTGLERTNLGWTVSLLAQLAPDAVPADFPGALDDVLARLEDKGLVSILAGDPGDALGDIVLLGEPLLLLSRAVLGSIGFGLRVHRLTGDATVEMTACAGWRSSGGIAVLEASALEEGRAELLLAGPTEFMDLLGELLGATEASEQAAVQEIDAAYAREALLVTIAKSGSGTCHACGADLPEQARFCPGCGAARAAPEAAEPVAPAPPTCAACGEPARSGAKFCRHCGAQLG